MADAIETFARPDDFGELRASELHTSLTERMDAQIGEAAGSGTRTLLRLGQYALAERGVDTFEPDEFGGGRFVATRDHPDVSIADAQARVKTEGLEKHLKLPEQDTMKQGVLDLMIAHAHERRQYEAAVSRGPQGIGYDALGFITEMGAGIIDPVNIAAFSMPVLGEARLGMMMAGAGESIAKRAGIRAGVGAAQGAVGGAALAPGDWWLHTKDGVDYTMADALRSIALSAGMGSAFHSGLGALGDMRAGMRGQPLPGSIEDLRARAVAGDTHAAEIVERLGDAGTHLPEAALEQTGIPLEEVPGVTPAQPQVSLPPHPSEVLADLPPRVREDVNRAAIADVINGNNVRAGELLQEAAKEDPRIAETIEAYHASPYAFDEFDISRVGTGEGAQTYGHGHYVAENPEVAQSYLEQLKHKSPLTDEATANFYLLRHPGDRAAALAEFNQHIKAYKGTYSNADLQAQAKIRETIDRAAYGGMLYKVRINAKKEHFLDYDKPLEDQPHILEKIKPKLREELEDMLDRAGLAADLGPFSGRELYQLIEKKFEDPALASKFLHELGVPGIKYLDQGSRKPREADLGVSTRGYKAFKAEFDNIDEQLRELSDVHAQEGAAFEGYQAFDQLLAEQKRLIAEANKKYPGPVEGTSNFVVFNDKLVRITHKNGKEVGLDEMKPAAPLHTGRPQVDAVLAEPSVAQSIANPKINRKNDVPYEAGASEGADTTTNIDKRIPDQVTISGKTFDPAIPANIHEQVEKFVMERLIAKYREAKGEEPKGKAIEDIYERAHHEYAEPAEDAWYRANGIDVDEVNKWWAKQDRITEHENPKDPPANLYTKPYPHNEVEGVKHEDRDAAADWPVGADARVGSPAAKGPRTGDKKTLSLFEFLADSGGLKPDPELAALLGGKNPTVRGFGKLLREDGMSLDRAREAAVEAGYLEDAARIDDNRPTESTINHLLDAIGSEERGTKVYRIGDEPRDGQNRDQLRNDIERELDAVLAKSGIQPSDAVRARAIDIMEKQSVRDPLSAYVRATKSVTGRADWQLLADAKRDGDGDLVAASREAEATPEPASIDPQKAPSAAEAAAKEADQLLADILPKLSDEERAQFEEALNKLDQDKLAQEQMVREGAACLAAAAA